MFTVIGIIVAVIIVILLLVTSYRKTGPDVAMVITGAALGKGVIETNSEVNSRAKIVKGGGSLVLPILQSVDYLDLKTRQIDVSVPNTQSNSMVFVNVNATAILRVGSSKQMIAVAAEKIMNLPEEELQNQLSEMVRGQIRTIVSEMDPAELVTNKQKFQDAVFANVIDQINKFGLEVTGFTITTITDDNDFYKSMSKPKLADKRREAENAESEANRRIREVAAQNEQVAQEAEQISQQNVSNYLKETAIIKAQNEQQSLAAKAESDRVIAEKNGDVDIMRQEKAAQVAKAQVEVSREKYNADVVAKMKAETDAQRLRADADAYSVKTDAEAAANSIRLNGQAEADALKAEGLAKAEAQEKLAQAFEKNGSAMLAKQIIEQLPDIATRLTEPLSSIDNMTVFNGAEGVNEFGVQGLSKTMDFVKNATGVDLQDIISQRAAGTITALDGKDIKTSKPESKK